MSAAIKRGTGVTRPVSARPLTEAAKPLFLASTSTSTSLYEDMEDTNFQPKSRPLSALLQYDKSLDEGSAKEREPMLVAKARMNRECSSPAAQASHRRHASASARRMKQQLIQQQQIAHEKRNPMSRSSPNNFKLDTALAHSTSNTNKQARPWSSQMGHRSESHGPSPTPAKVRPATAKPQPSEIKPDSLFSQGSFSMCGSENSPDYMEEILAKKRKYRSGLSLET